MNAISGKLNQCCAFFNKLRPNVLLLLFMGYFTLSIIFAVAVLLGEQTTIQTNKEGGTSITTVRYDVGRALDMIEGPLLALLGGSVALAKDLVRDDEERTNLPNPPTT